MRRLILARAAPAYQAPARVLQISLRPHRSHERPAMLNTRQKVLRNFWYATLPADTLKQGPKPFRLLGQPIVLFLDEKDEPAALETAAATARPNCRKAG
jgi:hypothetical protein